MISKFKTALLAASALVLSLSGAVAVHAETAPAVAGAAPAEVVKPALWVIRDADSTIYLLGSIHVMKDGTPWLNSEIQSRFDSAQDAWFEIPDLDNKAAAIPLAQKYMFDPKGTMTDGLTPDEIAQLDTLLKPSGMNTQMLKPMRKWAVTLIITLQQIGALGYQTERGVDVTLMAQARAANKGVHGFETMEQQLQALVPNSQDEELTTVRVMLRDMPTLPQDIRDLFDAWKRGDAEALSHLMIDKMQDEDPNGYRRLIVERNAAWEPQIEQILAGKGTVFITVGAGHLVGPDSVIAMLKQHGITAERVNY